MLRCPSERSRRDRRRPHPHQPGPATLVVRRPAVAHVSPPMIFAAPWVLLALAALPVLWWLLRVTPPAPRSERFPAIRLLAGLRAPEETPARTPWWLMAVRLLAASLLIVGLAGPVLDAGVALPGAGPLLVVIDDGWAAAADWPGRVAAADAMLARAAREHRPAALLATADANDARPPAISAVMPVADLRARLAALRPKPWPVDRAGAAAALRRWATSRRAGRLSGRWPRHHRRCRLRRRPAPRRVGDRNCPRSAADDGAAAPARRAGPTGGPPGTTAAADGSSARGAGAKRRRPHPGARDLHPAARRAHRRGRDHAAARAAQPAGTAGAGRPRLGRRRRPAGRALAAAPGRADVARRGGERAALGHALLSAARPLALCRAARGQHRHTAQAADRGDRACRRAFGARRRSDRTHPMGREGRAAGALCRPAHRSLAGAGDRSRRAAPSGRAGRAGGRAAAGEAAGRRPPARRRALLGEAGAARTVSARLALRGAGGAGGRDREPAGARRTLGAAGAAHLGAAR